MLRHGIMIRDFWVNICAVRCWDIRSTRSSEAWVTSLVITYTKSIWKMVMHADGEKQDFTQYFHASENNPKKWEICTVQQQMCIVQVPYQCFCWCFKRHKDSYRGKTRSCKVCTKHSQLLKGRSCWGNKRKTYFAASYFICFGSKVWKHCIMIYTGKYVHLISNKCVEKLLWCSKQCLQCFCTSLSKSLTLSSNSSDACLHKLANWNKSHVQPFPFHT